MLEGLGAEIVTVKIPEFPPALREAWFSICSYEARRAHAATYPSRAARYGPYFREFLDYIDISEAKFNELVDAARSPHLWRRDGDGWALRRAVWMEEYST